MIDQEKLSSIRQAAMAIAIVSVIAFVSLILYSIYQLKLINTEIEKKNQRLNELRQREEHINGLLRKKNEEIKSAEAQIAELKRTKEFLLKVESKHPSDESRRAIKEVIDANPKAADILPRVYIHIIREDQRSKAERVAEELRKRGYLVPGIENVSRRVATLTHSQLRYFSESNEDGDDVKNIMTALLHISVRVEKTRLAASQRIRPRHYELWFGSDF